MKGCHQHDQLPSTQGAVNPTSHKSCTLRAKDSLLSMGVYKVQPAPPPPFLIGPQLADHKAGPAVTMAE